MTSLDNYVTKADLTAAIAGLKAELESQISALETRVLRDMKNQTWALVAAMGAMATVASVIIGGMIAVAHFFHW